MRRQRGKGEKGREMEGGKREEKRMVKVRGEEREGREKGRENGDEEITFEDFLNKRTLIVISLSWQSLRSTKLLKVLLNSNWRE